MSSTVAGTTYGDSGFTIDTDATGAGTVSIPNTASGALLVGHNVKIGDDTAPNNQTPLAVAASTDKFAQLNLLPGANGPATITLAQAVGGQGSTLLETWNANTVITLRLNPSEASWVNLGTLVVPHGDVSAQLESFGSQAVSVRILNDPSITTIDDIDVQGLGINVIAPIGGSVGLQFEWTGSSSEYLDGQFIQSHTWPTLQSYELSRVTVGTQIPAISEWGFIVLTLLLLTAATILFARRGLAARPA